ncbi:MAG: radical SAM protein [Clostridia bacterium]|nr:radical SAM protein [Clostridia bacterium]
MPLTSCRVCPRACGVDRTQTVGYCGAPAPFRLARAALHFGEEPCISGSRGAGAVFFSGCPLGCLYCQNHEISRGQGEEVSDARLATIFRELAAAGAHNLDLVTPTHYTPRLLPLLREAPLPVVWNCGGYERIDTLRALEGLVPIYLPDFKYVRDDTAAAFSAARDYPAVAKAALLEMARQVGEPVFDDEGVMQRGLLVRHLVLPGHSKESVELLRWCADHLPPSTHYSIMAQYTPTPAVAAHRELGRRLTTFEYRRVADEAARLGLRGYCQELDAAEEGHVPAFDGTGLASPATRGGTP